MGRGEKGEGVDEGLLRNLEKAVDASAEGAEAVEADEAVEGVVLEDAGLRRHHRVLRLLEGVEVCLEEVEMAVPRPQRRRPSSRLALLWRWLQSHFGDRGWRL